MEVIERLQHACREYLEGRLGDDDFYAALTQFFEELPEEQLREVAWHILTYKTETKQ